MGVAKGGVGRAGGGLSVSGVGVVAKARAQSGLRAWSPVARGRGLEPAPQQSSLEIDQAGGAHLSRRVGRAGSLDPRLCPRGYSSRSAW